LPSRSSCMRTVKPAYARGFGAAASLSLCCERRLVGCHGFAPCSRRLRAGTSLSKFATLCDAMAELNRRSQACEVMTGTGIRVANVERRSPNRRVDNHAGTGSSRIGVRRSRKLACQAEALAKAGRASG